jgi:hypothetical protein
MWKKCVYFGDWFSSSTVSYQSHHDFIIFRKMNYIFFSFWTSQPIFKQSLGCSPTLIRTSLMKSSIEAHEPAELHYSQAASLLRTCHPKLLTQRTSWILHLVSETDLSQWGLGTSQSTSLSTRCHSTVWCRLHNCSDSSKK